MTRKIFTLNDDDQAALEDLRRIRGDRSQSETLRGLIREACAASDPEGEVGPAVRYQPPLVMPWIDEETGRQHTLGGVGLHVDVPLHKPKAEKARVAEICSTPEQHEAEARRAASVQYGPTARKPGSLLKKDGKK